MCPIGNMNFVICGLAAVVGQASKAPPLSSYLTAASCARAPSAPQPGERTRLVQPVSEPLRSKGRAHAQEMPVEELDRERVVPEAAQMQADPPSVAAYGSRGREEHADSETGQASRAA